MDSNHWVEVDDGVQITQIIITIAGSVAGAFSEVFQTTAKIIMAAVIITIVAGVLSLTPGLIADVAGGQAAKVLPPIGLFANGAIDPVRWPDSGAFTLTDVGLNGAFQFGGDPHFGA